MYRCGPNNRKSPLIDYKVIKMEKRAGAGAGLDRLPSNYRENGTKRIKKHRFTMNLSVLY